MEPRYLTADGGIIKLSWWHLGRFFWAFCLPLESASIAAAAFAENNADALGERQGRKGGAEGQISFDLPAQPLASALEQYSVVSGLQVVYDGTLAEGHESTPVKGNFSPEVALRILLDGTGLSPRYMATDGFVLVPARPDPAADTVSAAAGAQYYGRIQSRLEGALCANDRTRSGGYRIALGIWIAPSGVITRSALLGSSGDTSLDAVIDRMTRGLVIGAPPPPGFAQPVTLLVTPELMRDCQAVQGEGAQP